MIAFNQLEFELAHTIWSWFNPILVTVRPGSWVNLTWSCTKLFALGNLCLDGCGTNVIDSYTIMQFSLVLLTEIVFLKKTMRKLV